MLSQSINQRVGHLDNIQGKGGQLAQSIQTILVGNELENHLLRLGIDLETQVKEQMFYCLRSNTNIVAWKPRDMPNIDPKIIMHKLNVDHKVKPIQQHMRKFPKEKNEIIISQVAMAKETRIFKEVDYLKWLSNVVLVKKTCGSPQICMAFTDLNSACPKYCFPLPSIN